MNKIYGTFLVVVLLFITVLSGCLGPQTTASFKRTYSVEAGTVMTVLNINGRVVVSEWNESVVNVSAEKVSFGGQEELNRAEVRVTEGANALAIETRYTGSSLNPPTVSYTIHVPANVTVTTVSSTNGQVQVMGVSGNVSVTTTNGEVILQNIQGYVSASTSNGHLLVRNVTGILGLETSNGAVEADVNGFSDGTHITTSNGAVTLWINASINGTFDFSTSNGGITNNGLPLTVVSSDQTHLVGTLGRGARHLTVTTSNGHIVLNKLA